jgi:hypothetical protein
VNVNDGSTDETWRAIPGYDGWYEVSDLGRVRSWKRHPGRSGRLGRRTEPRILTPVLGSAGRLQIALTDPVKTWKIHRLVALTFLGPRPEGQEIAHANSDKLDNRLSNLRYTTHVDNLKDEILNGVPRPVSSLGRPKLDADSVRQIRASGESNDTLAGAFGVGNRAIRDIRAGRTWPEVA